MWFFNTRCNVAICNTCITGLNRETVAADKWNSTSTGVLNTRPLCSSVHLFISKRISCLFRPRENIWLYLCETLPSAATTAAGEQSDSHYTLLNAREEDAILSSSTGSRFWDCILLRRFWVEELRHNLIFHVSTIIHCTFLTPLSIWDKEILCFGRLSLDDISVLMYDQVIIILYILTYFLYVYF